MMFLKIQIVCLFSNMIFYSILLFGLFRAAWSAHLQDPGFDKSFQSPPVESRPKFRYWYLFL